MKEEVRTVFGKIETKELETEGQLFGFYVGDIITCECGECGWDGKYVLVKGFDRKNQRLYGIEFDGREIGYDVTPQESYHKQKLRIVQRNPRFLYRLARRSEKNPPELKAGDEVLVVNDWGAGFQGKVIAINPTPNHMNPYVIELFGFRLGEKSPADYAQINDPKILPSTCVWKAARELILVKDIDKEAPEDIYEGEEIPAEKPAEAEETKVDSEKQAMIILYWYLKEVLCKADKNYPLINHEVKLEFKVSYSRPEVKTSFTEEDLKNLVSEKTADSARMAIRELGVYLYEMLTGHSERTDISFLLDGYPNIENSPDISTKFAKIIHQMIAGSFKDPETLKKVFEERILSGDYVKADRLIRKVFALDKN